MTPSRAPRINTIGLVSWDRLLAVTDYPEAGGSADVLEEISAPGGTTANTAVALARLGAESRIAAAIGDDERGQMVLRALAAERVDVDWLTVKPGQITDLATMIVSKEPLERTVLWEKGAQLVRHDRLDIAGLFGGDLLVLDVADIPLRRFLLDLPAHTAPAARLLGPLTYLADSDHHHAFDLALRHDAIAGSERDLLRVTGTWSPSDAVTALQHRMRGETLRAAFITRGAEGCRVITESDRWNVPAFPVAAIDPTGAGDAFVAGVAWGMAQRWEWLEIGRFANAVGALACCSLGAQHSLPTLAEVESLLAANPPSPEGPRN